ncbi:MAG: hypothetical protein GY853_16565 [PVC group bacterium]|nr:hypothetical protein [PVC group bacterium]
MDEVKIYKYEALADMCRLLKLEWDYPVPLSFLVHWIVQWNKKNFSCPLTDSGLSGNDIENYSGKSRHFGNMNCGIESYIRCKDGVGAGMLTSIDKKLIKNLKLLIERGRYT